MVTYLYEMMGIFFAIGVLSAFLFRSSPRLLNYTAHGMAVLGSLTAVLCAVFVLQQGTVTLGVLEWRPFMEIPFRLDSLAACFLLLTGGVGGIVSLYAIGYCREYEGKGLAGMAGFYNLFLATMTLVLSVQHVIGFLFFWEMMTLASFFLVVHDRRDTGNTRAGFVYIVMTQIGTAFLIGAFFLLGSISHTLDFAFFSKELVMPEAANIIFLLALLGFGTKAGMVPLHIWLPSAHPAAPSHVSALMSGVMLKVAIYGFCRFIFHFLPNGPEWWGWVVLLMGGISAIVGAVYALAEQDLKRLLAYSSVENIGIIFMALGAGLIYAGNQAWFVAQLAWGAALCHIMNHGVFKALLFMGAGAIQQNLHHRDMEKMGGLIRFMPYTAGAFLVGGMALAALPPFNGFVSEWLTFQSLLLIGQHIPGISSRVLAALMVAVLGMTGTIAAAAFLKAYGGVFLAKPRSEKIQHCREVSRWMVGAMGSAAVLIVAMGVYPTFLLQWLAKITATAGNGLITLDWQEISWTTVGFQFVGGEGGLSLIGMIGLVLGGLLLGGLVWRWRGKPSVVWGETWTCGIIPDAKMEYTTIGFAQPVIKALQPWFHVRQDRLYSEGDNAYFGRSMYYDSHMRYIVSELLYRPMNQNLMRLSAWMKSIQAGSVQLYVGYVLMATVLILLWSTRW